MAVADVQFIGAGSEGSGFLYFPQALDPADIADVARYCVSLFNRGAFSHRTNVGIPSEQKLHDMWNLDLDPTLDDPDVQAACKLGEKALALAPQYDPYSNTPLTHFFQSYEAGGGIDRHVDQNGRARSWAAITTLTEGRRTVILKPKHRILDTAEQATIIDSRPGDVLLLPQPAIVPSVLDLPQHWAFIPRMHNVSSTHSLVTIRYRCPV